MDSQADKYAHDFANRLSNKTGGQAEVQIFPNAQLGAEAEAVKAVQIGTLNMTLGSTPFLSDAVPEIGTDQLPFLFDSWAHARRCLEGAYADELTKRATAKTNVRPLSWISFGWRDMYFRDKRITDPSAMNGLKMRVPQLDIYVRMIELLGAKPTSITFSEVYTAVQSGVVAGFETPLQLAIDGKLFEVIKYLLLTQHMFSSITHMANKDFFNGLPKNVQTASVEAAKEATKVSSASAETAEAGAVAIFKQKGVTVDSIADRTPWKKAMQPLLDDWAKKNPGATSLFDLINKAAK